MMQLCKKKN